jgi:hypothetical protein
MIRGHFDQNDASQVRGWVFDDRAPGKRLLVDLYDQGRFIGQVLANGGRPDLVRSGLGDGYHGFTLYRNGRRVSSPGGVVEARIPAWSRFGRWMPRPKGAMARHFHADIASYLQATLGRLELGQAAPAALLAGGEDIGGNSSRSFDALFEPSSLDHRVSVRGKKPSAYLDYVAHRYGIEADFDPGLDEGQFQNLLAWYLRDYAASRPGLRVPLSEAEIEFLNQPSSSEPEFSRWEEMFKTRFSESTANHRAEWRLWNAAALGLEDIVRTPALAPLDVPVLEGMPGADLSRLGLRLWLDRHPVLKQIPTTSAEDRRRACVLLMLFSSVAPHLLQLLTPAVIACLVDPSSGRSDFELFAEEWLGPSTIRLGDWLVRIESLGFDLARGRFRSITDRGHRLEAARRIAESAPLVDVQIFGPFSKALGVGQSCRRLAMAIAQTGYRVRICDFALDYPNADAPMAGFLVEDPGPARLNLIHLNLEEIPKLFAYFPDVFTGAVNIACPYAELSSLAKEQILGCQMVDEIWAASTHIADLVRDWKPVRLVGSALETMPAPDRQVARGRILGERVVSTDFLALTTCDALSGLHRKNPVGAVRAFFAAFPDQNDVKLVVKTHSLDRAIHQREQATWASLLQLSRQDPRLIILDDHLDETGYRALQASADVLVSLHRAEGLGYNILEAMAMNVACIVTDYSGTQDFCFEDNAYLIGADLVPVRPGEYPFTRGGDQVWAEPRHDEAVAALRRAYLDPDDRAARARKARTFIDRNFSIGAFSKRLDTELDRLLGKEVLPFSPRH